jgi:hypothetical protein
LRRVVYGLVYREEGDNKECDNKSKKANGVGRVRVERSKTIIRPIGRGAKAVCMSNIERRFYCLEARSKQVSGKSTQSTLRKEDKTVEILRCKDALERDCRRRLKTYLYGLANTDALLVDMNFVDRFCQREVHRFDILNEYNLWHTQVEIAIFL